MTKALNIIFAGTPDFAASALQACIASRHHVVAVYTQPDRPAGRGRKINYGPVKQLAIDACRRRHWPDEYAGDDGSCWAFYIFF